jgi:pimeloyl-ACP methyl ester carboxylesterase
MWPGLLILLGAAALIWMLIISIGIAWSIARPARVTEAWAMARQLPADPGEASLDFEEAHFTDADGVGRPVWLIEGRRDDGPILLMLHAWAESRINMLQWAIKLQPTCGAMALFDRRGHGECPHPADRQFHRECEDVGRLITWLGQRYPNRPIVLLGSSQGAVVAVLAALGGGVDGVIADSPYRYVLDPIRRVVRARRLPTLGTVELAAVWLYWRAPGQVGFDLADQAEQLTVPLLVMHGQADHIVPIDHAQAVADRAPRGRLVRFDQCDHLEAIAGATGRYRQALIDWFADIDDATGPGPTESSADARQNEN